MKKHNVYVTRWLVAGFVFAVAGRVLVGCGGGGGGSASMTTFPEGTSATSNVAANLLDSNAVGTKAGLTGRGSVAGYVFRTSTGTFAFILRPTATAVAGQTPVAGATVGLTSMTTTVRTDTTGRFVITGVPAGSHTLRVTSPGRPIAIFLVTAVGDAIVLVGQYPITRQRAIEIVKQAVAKLPNATNTIVVGAQNPFPAGVTVAPGMGNVRGVADATLALRLPSPQWFFFVDAFPDTMWQHPVTYMFVNAATGAVTTRSGRSWPLVNGVGFYRNHDANILSSDIVQKPTKAPTTVARENGGARPVTPALPLSRLTQHDPRDHVSGCGATAKSYAILIQGGEETGMTNSFNALHNMLTTRQGVRAENIITVRPFAPNPLGEIQAALAGLKSRLQPCDTLYFMVVAHGYSGGFEVVRSLKNQGSIAAILNINRDTQTVAVGTDDLDFTGLKACHFCFYIDACNSGSWIDPVKAQLIPQRGLQATIITLTSADRTGVFARSWLELQSPGLIFSKYFVNNVLTFPGSGPVHCDAAFDATRRNLEINSSAPTLTGLYANRAFTSNPQMWVRPMGVGETCAIPTPTPGGVRPPTPTPPSTGGPTPTPGPTVTPRPPQTAVRLEHPAGTYPVGRTIPLSSITGGRVGAPEGGCASNHLHGAITILDNQPPLTQGGTQGPFDDPNPTGCGWGVIVQIP